MMTNEYLAELANNALYAAMAVFTFAMLAFVAVVAVTTSRDDSDERAALVETDPVDPINSVESVAEPVLAGVGRSGYAVPQPSEAGTARARDTAGSAPAAGATLPSAAGLKSGSMGMTLAWVATFLLGTSVALRGLSVHRMPVANMFEFATFMALLVMVVFLGMSLKWPLRWLGLFVVTPVLLVLGLALAVWYTPAGELVPSLKSTWIVIHVPIAILSVALFTIGFAVLLLHLGKARSEQDLAGPERASRFWRLFDSLPSARALDRTAYSLHIAAFPLWTFSVIAGAIWAQQAWGSYWNWDPKEVWTFVIWVIYAAYLHARATAGTSLRTANILACVGYLAIIINFAVVNIYFVGQHSYSGV